MMRRLSIIVMVLCLAVPVSAQFSRNKKYTCFDRIEKDIRGDDTVSIYTDSGVIRGVSPVLSATSSLLYLRPVSSEMQAGVTIPYGKINRITYQKRGGRKTLFGVVGFLFGAVGGAAMGAALAPEPESRGFLQFDFTQMYWAMGGGLFGGVVGGAIGVHVGGKVKHTVTLRCF